MALNLKGADGFFFLSLTFSLKRCKILDLLQLVRLNLEQRPDFGSQQQQPELINIQTRNNDRTWLATFGNKKKIYKLDLFGMHDGFACSKCVGGTLIGNRPQTLMFAFLAHCRDKKE